MRISVVTISWNQVRFLRACIESVLAQDHPDVEYIVVDAGSTDGSRTVIDSYGDRLIRVFEADDGPADGLNKGFARATGDVFGYLNSDDVYLPGALSTADAYLRTHPSVDVVRGHARVIDEAGAVWRKVYSDPFSLRAISYGTCTSVQPSTFFRAGAYVKSSGFNVDNRSNWDEELLVDMAVAGATIASLDAFLSCYRIHGDSITGSGRLHAAHALHRDRMFEKISGRPSGRSDGARALAYRLLKHARNPRATLERLRHGPMYASS